jgi:RND family efflux transporter MFP subunit
VAFVHVDEPVEVNIVSSGQSFPAKISRFAQKVDTATRTMLTEVDVENADFHFTPGMYATVRLSLSQKKDALAIPIQCVSAGDKPTVLVLDHDHKVEERPVTIGLETSSMAEILTGLNEDDLVVTGNRSSISLGQVALAKEMSGGKL